MICLFIIDVFFFNMHIIIYNIYICIICVFNIEYIHVELKNLARLGQDFFSRNSPASARSRELCRNR